MALQRSSSWSVENQREPDSQWGGHRVPTEAAHRKETAGAFDLKREALSCTCHGKVEYLGPEAVPSCLLVTLHCLSTPTVNHLQFSVFITFRYVCDIFRDICQAPQSIFRKRVAWVLLPFLLRWQNDMKNCGGLSQHFVFMKIKTWLSHQNSVVLICNVGLNFRRN